MKEKLETRKNDFVCNANTRLARIYGAFGNLQVCRGLEKEYTDRAPLDLSVLLFFVIAEHEMVRCRTTGGFLAGV